MFLDDNSIDCCVTSPPYWGLRDYGVAGQLGLESTLEDFIKNMADVFAEVRRVLKPNGTLWLNIGDSYAAPKKNRSLEQAIAKSTLGGGFTSARQCLVQQSKITDGLKSKDLCGVPWRLAFALQQAGWYLRQDIIWHKTNPMPESVRDRCTKAHEYIFLLSKSEKYYYDVDSIREPTIKVRPATKRGGTFHDHASDLVVGQRIKEKLDHPLGKNKRSVWSVSSTPLKDAHFATFPQKLIEPCILAGCPAGGTVLDPFFGAGTTGVVAKKHKRKFIGIELNPAYIKIARKRLEATV